MLLQEALAVLVPRAGEVAVDCTLGLAGHAVPLLRAVGPAGRLIGLDWDAANLPRARELLAEAGSTFALYPINFAALPAVLAQEGIEGADLLIADLGMSSMQVDDPERGFSYLREGPLDMRMDRSRGRTAAQLLADISEEDLARALAEFGDEPAAAEIARALVSARDRQPLSSTSELARVVAAAVGEPAGRGAGWRLHPRPGIWRLHPAARTFQALRILVNRELSNLDELLRVVPQSLRPGGRAVLISFHSGEDRLVKAAFRAGVQAGLYDSVSPEPIRAGDEEKSSNPRSRSAKLRWAKKTARTD